MEKVEIRTKDGSCPAYVHRPEVAGPWPAVLMFMDGIGIRPAMLEVAEHLSTYGYYVLLPDLFYRSGPYAAMDPRATFSDPEKRKVLMDKYFSLASPANVMADTQAYIDYLLNQREVREEGIAVVGYCRGGMMALHAAGHYPQQILLTASFHGGRLATDDSDSPHLLAGNMKSRVYIAGAIEDQSFTDEMKQRLGNALTAAHVQYKIETYQARHGWVIRDTPAFDADAAERHWQTLEALLRETFACRVLI